MPFHLCAWTKVSGLRHPCTRTWAEIFCSRHLSTLTWAFVQGIPVLNRDLCLKTALYLRREQDIHVLEQGSMFQGPLYFNRDHCFKTALYFNRVLCSRHPCTLRKISLRVLCLNRDLCIRWHFCNLTGAVSVQLTRVRRHHPVKRLWPLHQGPTWAPSERAAQHGVTTITSASSRFTYIYGNDI